MDDKTDKIYRTMKEEKIEKAADDFLTRNSPSYTECFKQGARWRVESAWHGRDEPPLDGMDKEGRGRLCLFMSVDGPQLGQAVLSFGECKLDSPDGLYPMGEVERWAYLDDLNPWIGASPYGGED